MTPPPLVQRFVARALPADGAAPGRVRVAQSGEMWRKPGGRALRFTAVEELAVGEMSFSWRARFPFAPLLSLRVHDRYRAGEGALEGRLLGFPVLRSRGAVDTPFRGDFADYGVLGGVRVPRTAEVGWDLPEGRFVYFRGRVTALGLEE
jgi:hypothetical protein